MMRKYSIEDCQKLAKSNGGQCLSIECIDRCTKILWECEKKHRWSSKVCNLTRGTWCPRCANKDRNRKYDIYFVRKFVENKGGTLITENYIDPNQRLEILCKDKHLFYPTFGNLLHKNTWCNTCSYSLKRDTWIEKYGVDNPSKAEKVKLKAEKTCLERYGTKYPFQNSVVKEKSRQTCLKKYGVTNYAVSSVGKNRYKQTILKKYGVEYTHQNPTIALKAAKSSNKSTILCHWKDKSELVCVGSYETAVVNYLNLNKIDFTWQSKAFIMPDARTYRPDLYLVDEDKWIEIKGYLRKDAQEKWDWFHETYPNSELWDKRKLKEMDLKIR